jgi:hypothetical protein
VNSPFFDEIGTSVDEIGRFVGGISDSSVEDMASPSRLSIISGKSKTRKNLTKAF